MAGPRTVPGRGLRSEEGICTKEGCDWPKQRGEVLGCREASWFRATSFPTRVRVRRASRNNSEHFNFLLSAKGKQYVFSLYCMEHKILFSKYAEYYTDVNRKSKFIGYVIYCDYFLWLFEYYLIILYYEGYLRKIWSNEKYFEETISINSWTINCDR